MEVGVDRNFEVFEEEPIKRGGVGGLGTANCVGLNVEGCSSFGAIGLGAISFICVVFGFSLESFGMTIGFGLMAAVVRVGVKGGNVSVVVLNKLGGKGGD